MNPPACAFDFKQWQSLQNLFSEIIGTNITFLDAEGTALSVPSQATSLSSEMAQPFANDSRAEGADCAFRSFREASKKGTGIYQCAHRLHYYNTEILVKGSRIGFIVLGPLLIGKRDDEGTYRDMCKALGLRDEVFLDRVRDLKLFSPDRIRVIGQFLQQLAQYSAGLDDQKNRVEELLPGFLEHPTKFFSGLYAGQIANFLLDIAGAYVGADSGSVLLLDKKAKNFTIETARGLNVDVASKSRVSYKGGVAGWVASRKQPILINRSLKESSLRKRLKRPQLRSSMVVPLLSKRSLLGLFCLNTKKQNKRFNQANLLLMSQFGKLAGTALSRASS
ncbi:MAG: PocR ligand-binding domain-containing protein [Candidatus Omnitrophota bacterium]|nr:PocR ligand-binding domain-containing protein [Candidatus Omnitrophota bacterium]